MESGDIPAGFGHINALTRLKFDTDAETKYNSLKQTLILTPCHFSLFNNFLIF